MRNRALYGALRDFALEAAALLTDDLRAGAEVEFDVIDQAGRRGPALYRYKPRTEAFLAERWPRLRELDTRGRLRPSSAAGAALWLRVNGAATAISGEQAEPALRAMLERLYEDATSFGFPEERFERVYREVEATLYRDALAARVVAPLRGVAIEADRIELGDGLALVRGERADAPAEAVWPENGDGEPAVLCVLERDVTADDGISATEAEERFTGLVSALRLWAPGRIGLGAPGWRRTDEGPWQPLPFGGGAGGTGGRLVPAERRGGRPARVLRGDRASRPAAARGLGVGALRDGLRARLGRRRAVGLPARPAGAAGRDERRRRGQPGAARGGAVRRGGPAPAGAAPRGGGDRAGALRDGRRAALVAGRRLAGELVAEVEGHLRAMLRDVLCGYLDSDLKGVADDILLETNPEPFVEIQARDLRVERPEPPPAPSPSRSPEPEPELPGARVATEPERRSTRTRPRWRPSRCSRELEGVTQSADWGFEDPRIFGPV